MSSGVGKSGVVAGQYRVLRALGSGAHGTVDLAEDLLNGGRRVALKRLEGIVGAGDPEPAADVLRWFQHPRWAEILDEGRLDAHGRFQVLRYVPGAGLDKAELPRPAEEVFRFLEDGARVLRALHRLGVIHYDVTPGNFVRDETPEGVTFTLTDGGLANLGPVRGIARGTPQFMAPEVVEGSAHDHRADLYALGLVAFRLATGTDPFTGGAGDVLGRRRREDAPLLRTLRPDLPEALERIVSALLQRDPARRPAHAGEILELLARAGRSGADRLGPEEATAFASAGPLIGRGGVLERFRSACREITTAPPARTPGEEFFLADGPPDLPDLVLVLHGPAGVGATRVLREMSAVARGEGLPVLALSGRAGAADRRSAVRRLSECLALLAPDGDPYLAAAGQSRSGGAESVDGRAMERFVELCERVTSQRAVVLLVEDFAELPLSSQEALRVLARHLQTRAEHPDGRRLPRLLLVIDHGADDPKDLLIPDARDPRRPCVPVGPFTEAETAAFLARRLDPRRDERGGDAKPDDAAYRPLPGDIPLLHRATEGLPRLLAAAMAEALVRGDLRSELQHWVWDTGPVPGYALRRTLPLAALRAVESAPLAVRDAAVRLALFDAPIPAALLAAVCGEEAVAALVRTPLAIVSQEGANVRLAPASRAVRDTLRSQPPQEVSRHRQALLAELELRPGSDLAPDHARLLLEEGRARAAFERITRDEVAPRSTTPRTLQVLGRILSSDPTLLAAPAARSATARRLSTVPEAVTVADALYASIPAVLAPEDLDGASLLAAHDYAARRYDRVVDLASRAEGLAVTGLAARHLAHLRVNHARAVLAQRPDAAAPLLRAAALSLRHLDRSERSRALELRAEYELASARWRMTRGQFAQAVALHSRLLRRARDAAALPLVAQGYTNVAVALQSAARHEEAERAAARAVRIRQALGDFAGAAGTLHNLARLKELRGRVREATALYQRVVGIGCRLAHHEGAALALTRLAAIYQGERNPRLAITALLRARQLSGSKRNAPAFASASRAASSLLSLMGDIQRGRTLLAESCRTARARNRAEARTAHLEAVATRDFLFGSHARAAAAMQSAIAARGGVPADAVLLGLRATALLERASTGEARTPILPTAARTPAHRALRSGLALLLRLARAPGESALTPVLELLSTAGVQTSSTGGDAAIHCEVALAVARLSRMTRTDAALLLNQVAKVSAQQDYAIPQARALALRATFSLVDEQPARASLDVSSALAALSMHGARSGPLSHARFHLPPEFQHLLNQLNARYGTAEQVRRGSISSWTELHALAHVLSLQSGATAQPDTRMQTALRTILSVSARLKTRAGFEALLESLNRYAREITRAEHTCVVLVAPEGQGEIRIASASSATVGEEISRASHTIINRVLRARTPLLLHDVFGDSELMERPSITALGLRSIMCVPMIRGDQVYGAMYADSSAGAGSFDKVDLEILSLFAEQAAAAVETSRLLVDIQTSYAELKATQERLIRGERLRVMGEMTSGVAHEFNNLLTAILARIQLLSLEHLSPAVRESLQLMEKAALDAAGVVRRLQGFTRSQRQADYAEVDLADVCADVVEFLRPLWATRRQSGKPGIVVRLRSQPNLVVRGDATELREVVTNLLKNALDAIDKGGTIVLTAEARGGRVRVELRDDGPGIPKDNQARLFTPFFTTKGDRGTGLGLCLSQQIVERHGGEIRITSEQGQGTSAVFELPQARPASAQRVQLESRLEDPQVSVVVVDDDPDVLGPLCGYLARSGYDVRGANTASEALSLIASHTPGAVISDISMPGIDGMELCRRLHRLHPDLPVILMTGQTSDTDPVQVATAGAAALLPKPFTMRQVLELLARTARNPST